MSIYDIPFRHSPAPICIESIPEHQRSRHTWSSVRRCKSHLSCQVCVCEVFRVAHNKTQAPLMSPEHAIAARTPWEIIKPFTHTIATVSLAWAMDRFNFTLAWRVWKPPMVCWRIYCVLISFPATAAHTQITPPPYISIDSLKIAGAKLYPPIYDSVGWNGW